MELSFLCNRFITYSGIDGYLNKAKVSLLTKTESCVSINGYHWFNWANGHNLSQTLFSIFINDLFVAIEVKSKKRVQTNEKKIRILLYAYDIVLLTENKRDMQQVLDTRNKWRKNWRLD